MKAQYWVLTIIAAAALLAAAGLILLTMPRFATPLSAWAIETATGRDTTLDHARLKLFPIGYEMRALEIQGDIAPYRLGAMDLRFSPLGILPGRALIARASVADGQAGIRLKGEDRGEGGDFLKNLDEIARAEIENFVFVVSRDGDTQEFTITTASGRPAGGDVEAIGSGAGTTVFFNGRIAGPQVDGLRGALTVRGENFADFADLLGLAAPDTPPYELNGELSAGEDVWRLQGIDGIVGDSDLGGDFEVRLGRDRPLIIADLQSTNLELDDLGIIIGAPSRVSGETNALQEEINSSYAASDRLIPDSTLDLTRIRAVDARVDFRADSVQAGPLPLQALRLDMNLEDGVMRFAPIAFEAEAGNLEAEVVIDASEETPRHDIDGRLSDVRLEQFADGRFAQGGLAGRLDITASGNGFRQAASSANGAVTLYAQDGRIRQLGSEAAGLDLGEVLLLLLTEDPQDPEFTELNCAVARFAVEDGLARAAPVVFDSQDSLIVLDGTVNLDDESLDLTVETDAKDVSWGSLLGDPVIRGTLRNPAIGVDAGETALQAGAAALLGSLTGGLAALPFVELGDGRDADCEALLARAHGAAQTPPEPAAQ